MIYIHLAFKSLRNRLFSSLLIIVSIALSLVLLLSVERVKRSSEAGFTQSISQVDLLVGARTSPMNLILYSLFNMGSASNNISWDNYQKMKANPEVEWTIPYSLGDGHRGFRVIGTDENFYKYYRYRSNEAIELEIGKPALDLWDVVIGSDVEKKLNYKLGDKIIMSHGVTHGEGLQNHDDKPFHVTGILKPTGTGVDQSVFISLYGAEGMHLDWKDGAAPNKNTAISPDQILKDSIKFDEITAYFIHLKSKNQILKLQREINDKTDEALTAVIPAVELSQIWHGLSQIDWVLKIISMMVMGVGLASMLSSILTGLNERRREMSILRSIGAGPMQISFLLVIESSFLTLMGVILGLFIELAGFFILSNWLEKQFGFYVRGAAITIVEIKYMLIILCVGTLIGIIPAYSASRRALKDGLSVRI